MLRNLRIILKSNNVVIPIVSPKRFYLTNDYKCTDTWNTVNSSPIINKINLNDFYNQLEQNYTSKGVISAIDIDIFANAVKDPTQLEELKDLLHKLRLSAETGNTLESTHHAVVRSFINFGHLQELITILKDPLNYGLFLDDYSANILLNELLTQNKFDLAADVASLIMLQEEYGNEITRTLCQCACYKYIINYTPPEPTPPEPKGKKVEEIKIRVKFLRNPYFDDHFDIKDTLTLSAKTLAWISESSSDNLNNNLQIIGWAIYKKYDKLLSLCEQLCSLSTFKVYPEVVQLLEKNATNLETESKEILDKFITKLKTINQMEVSLEESVNNAIENAINKCQNNDIAMQQKLYTSWVTIREQKLEEQTKRLDRARRIQLIQDKQKEMQEVEQKLWFFDNEDKIDLEIEEKEKLVDKSPIKKKGSKIVDEDYVPPEILPKRR